MKTKTRLFPSLHILFEDSFILFKQCAFSLFLVAIFNILSVLGVVLTGIIWTSIFLFIPMPFLISRVLLVVGDLVIFVSGLIMLGVLWQITTISVLQAKGRVDLQYAVKKNYTSIVPVLIANILVGLLVYGGFVLLIIPGILFSLLFTFVEYEVILERTSVIEALKRSVGMVKKHFLEVFFRVLIIFGIGIFIQYIPGFIISDNEAFKGFILIISLIGNLLYTWYAQAYYITLYKQIKSITTTTDQGHLGLITFLSVIGWILGIVLLIGMILLAQNLMRNKSFQKNLHYYLNQKQDQKVLPSPGQSLSPKPPYVLPPASFPAKTT